MKKNAYMGWIVLMTTWLGITFGHYAEAWVLGYFIAVFLSIGTAIVLG